MKGLNHCVLCGIVLPLLEGGLKGYLDTNLDQTITYERYKHASYRGGT